MRRRRRYRTGIRSRWSRTDLGDLVAMKGVMKNRVEYDKAGELDEVVTNGGAHLERMGKRSWFLNCIRADGSAVCVWFDGKVTMVEERDA